MSFTRWPAVGPARWWAGCALALLAGTALQLQAVALLPNFSRLLLATLAAWVALLLLRLGARRRANAGLWLLGLLAAAVLGHSLVGARAELRLRESLPRALEGVDLQLTGHVASLPRISLAGTQFVFEVEAASHQGRPVQVPQRVSLGWYRGADDESLLAAPPEDLRAGQRWRFTARLRLPHGSMNPHGFDYELWLFEQGIRATGSVRATAAYAATRLPDQGQAPVQRWRQAAKDAIAMQVADPALAGVLAALAVGDQAAIARTDWHTFRITGVAHLMSISGLHVTMLAWLAAALVAAFWRRHPRLPLWLPAGLAARWSGVFFAGAYAVLAGWGVPAQRTVWMLAAWALLKSLGLRWPMWAVLLAAAVVVVLVDPWALLQPGFWLSFVAVALLVAAEPAAGYAQPLARATSGLLQRARVATLGQIGAGVRTQLVATVGLAPLSLLFFQQLSLVGLLANLAAIPVVTLLVTPLSLLGLLWAPLWSAAAAVLALLMQGLEWMASWPAAVWTAAVAPWWAQVLGLLAALLAIAPLPWRLRWLALPLMLPLLAPPLQRPPWGSFELVLADVGQGTAVLVRTRQHLLLYDAGPQYAPDSDAAGRVLLPLLQARGERELHVMMLSHRDIDHVGGAARILDELPVRALTSSLEPGHALLQQAAQAGIAHHACQAGQRWTWDGVQFEVLHPLADDLPGARAATPGGAPTIKSNALSCVLRVQAPGRSVLLAGDIEAAQEAELLARQAASAGLRSQLLLVPHHGSKTSSTSAFVEAVQPRWAVVQAAYRSRFGHPAPAVQARYEGQGVVLLRSDRCGAVTWPATPAQAAPVCQRRVALRYWHHPDADLRH